MDSRLANEADRALIETARRLTPEERLNAFLVHCRLLAELYQAGERIRAQEQRPGRGTDARRHR